MRCAVRTLFAASLSMVLPYARTAAAAPDAQVLAVFDIRSRLVPGERKLADAAFLTEQVRGVARRTLPQARVLAREELPAQRANDCAGDCDLKSARDAGADLLVEGDLLRIEDGFLVSLELRAVPSGRLAGAASATSSTPGELVEAVASAAVDLFRARKPGSAVAISLGSVPLPEVPAAFGPLQEGGVVDLEIDANVLVAYDEAQTVERRGEEQPEEAAAAWRTVAELGGMNPLREMAAARAKQWQRYAESKRAFAAQLARDTDRLRKVLPLGSVADSTKNELLLRYARAYGVEKASPLLALLPSAALRERAGLALGCEAKDAKRCVAMARAADESKDPKAALDYLDRACAAEDSEACAEAGDRWLRAETRDVARAIPTLHRGCAAGSAAACSRLARVYEEGDGTSADAELAAGMRDKACSAGDGKSCRRLACAVDDPAEARAAELWQKGCASGDPLSCAVAGAAAVAGQDRPVIQQQVEEAVAGAQPASAARPASLVPAAEATPPAAEAVPAAATAAEPPLIATERGRAGYLLIGLGIDRVMGAMKFFGQFRLWIAHGGGPSDGPRHRSRRGGPGFRRHGNRGSPHPSRPVGAEAGRRRRAGPRAAFGDDSLGTGRGRDCGFSSAARDPKR